MIRVAIADDSPFTCRLLASYLQEGGDCEVVGFAHTAPATTELVRQVTPDVLTLDLQMPGGGGLDLLRQITAESPVAVVVISGVTRRAPATTLMALEMGAVDFVLKFTPEAPVSRASLQREIVAKVRTAAAAKPANRRAPAAAGAPAPIVVARRPARPAPTPQDRNGVIVIGASTGGPQAIRELLLQLPSSFPAPCVIVQHLPAAFTAPFAAQLSRGSELRIAEATAADRLEPGRVLITPGSHHLVLHPGGRLELRAPTDRDRYCPSIDLAMMSAADSYGVSAVGVVLTGMGHDGAEGLKRIRDQGGQAYVQEPASCVIASMPERALERAGADHVARPERIGQLLAARDKT